MNDLQLLAKKAWLVCAGLMLATFIWDFYWLGVSDAGNQTKPDPLEMAQTLDTQQALVAILEHNLWDPTRKNQGDASDPVAGVETQQQIQMVNWRLTAVALVGEERTAVIGNPEDAASYRKYMEGDLLPSGEKILKILGDRVVYQTVQISDESKSNDSTNSTPDTKEWYLFGRKGE
jgi:hypothetical protein